MRAIKIDPVAKTITEIELAQNPNETLQELYDLIGCDLVELIQLDRGIIMAIDEEGKLKEVKGGVWSPAERQKQPQNRRKKICAQ